MISDSAFRSAAMLDDVRVMLKLTSGGFSDSDANEVAVNPTHDLELPAARRRKARRA